MFLYKKFNACIAFSKKRCKFAMQALKKSTFYKTFAAYLLFLKGKIELNKKLK